MKKRDDIELGNGGYAKKHKISFIDYLIIFLIIIILILSSVFARAWSRYSVCQSGSDSANVAKWYFRLVGNDEQSSDDVNFAFTRTDDNRRSCTGNNCTRNVW